jgi:hypothetical protein
VKKGRQKLRLHYWQKFLEAKGVPISIRDAMRLGVFFYIPPSLAFVSVESSLCRFLLLELSPFHHT